MAEEEPDLSIENEEDKEWQHSEKKRVLTKMITDEEIPSTMKPKQAYHELWLERHGYMEKETFKRRLYALRQQMKKYEYYAFVDNASYAHDAAYWEKNPKDNDDAEPRWDGSEAQRIVREAVTAGTHQLDPPKIYHQSHDAFKIFSLKKFRQHLHQEAKTNKWYRTQERNVEPWKPWNV